MGKRMEVFMARKKHRSRRSTGGKNSPFKAGTKKLKKGWRYPKGGGRPVRAKG